MGLYRFNSGIQRSYRFWLDMTGQLKRRLSSLACSTVGCAASQRLDIGQNLFKATLVGFRRKQLKQEIPHLDQTKVTGALADHIEFLLPKLGFQCIGSEVAFVGVVKKAQV